MEPEKLLQFQLPEVKDVKAYIVRLPDGSLAARTEEELLKEKPVPEKPASEKSL